MKTATQSSVQIYDELELRKASMGRPPRGRARRAPRPAISATSAYATAATAATAPRSASGGSFSAAAGRHFCPHRGRTRTTNSSLSPRHRHALRKSGVEKE